MVKNIFRKYGLVALSLALLTNPALSFARDVEYSNQEVIIRVNPGEPTQIQFPGAISGGFKRKNSAVSIDKKDTDLIVFAQEGIPEQGEAFIVRLDDGRSYSLRIQRSSAEFPRDDVIKLLDARDSTLPVDEEEPGYKEKKFDYAPPNQVSGLAREMALAVEFGKNSIAGYRASDRFTGQTVLDDGTLKATVEKIFIGANLWGYVLEVENKLDQSQKLNPATFRLDGTRAISASSWELAPKPLTVEQQASRKDKIKLYIVTRAH